MTNCNCACGCKAEVLPRAVLQGMKRCERCRKKQRRTADCARTMPWKDGEAPVRLLKSDLEDFTPAQIEARYQRARLAKRQRWVA